MIYNQNNEANISLRSLLEGEGYSFPCGGKGLCGKCRIVAPDLPITDLDRRFLSATELNLGERLACNKVISNAVEVKEVKFAKFVPKAKVKEGGIVALLYPDRTEVTLTDMENETEVETLILPTADEKTELRSIVGKNSVELFEKYNLATAPTVFMAGVKSKIEALLGEGDICDGSLNAVQYALPGDELYLAGLCDNATGTAVMESLEEEGMLIEISGEFASVIDKPTGKAVFAPYGEALAFAKSLNPKGVTIVGADAKGEFRKAFLDAKERSPQARQVAVAAVTSIRKRRKIAMVASAL